MTFDELIHNVKDWADAKDILKYENAPKQLMKVMEELGETAGAIAKNKKTDEIQDGIGDVCNINHTSISVKIRPN